MTTPHPAPDGRCLASGQIVIPYVDEPVVTVICPECGSDVPLDRLDGAAHPRFTIAKHGPGQTTRQRPRAGTQLMLDI